MSETKNIAELAALTSENIFAAFGWKMLDVEDENFPCEKIDKHQTKGAGGKHPIDCVFTYRDPFSSKHIFLLSDLKSYGAATIGSTDFAPYIRNLSKAIDCAQISDTWKNRFVTADVNDWTIDGLLFVYNHDQQYDADFLAKARGLAPASLPHGRTARVHLLDPESISYLQSVVADIKRTCGEKEYEYSKRKFFYPQQLLHPPAESFLPVATIELIRGRVITVILPQRLLGTLHAFLYLRNDGAISDFEYIITYLFRTGVMSLVDTVDIRGATFSSDAQSHFDVAKDQFWIRHYKMKEIKEALKRIRFGRVDRIITSFSTVDAAKLRKR